MHECRWESENELVHESNRERCMFDHDHELDDDQDNQTIDGTAPCDVRHRFDLIYLFRPDR